MTSVYRAPNFIPASERTRGWKGRKGEHCLFLKTTVLVHWKEKQGGVVKDDVNPKPIHSG